MIDQIKDIKYAKFSRLAAFLVDSLVFLSVWIISLFIFLNPTRGLGNVLVVVNSYLFLVNFYVLISPYFSQQHFIIILEVMNFFYPSLKVSVK
jgi:hypothetical protein